MSSGVALTSVASARVACWQVKDVREDNPMLQQLDDDFCRVCAAADVLCLAELRQTDVGVGIPFETTVRLANTRRA